ncbi:MAG TPA: hypothetical protein VLK65_29580 [Vicinamibacteria bacterium]|nr:hypothetical protein [Vicinamibacteria bacterium]
MSLINAPLRALFDIVLAPFSEWHPLVGLTFISLLTAVGLLVVFKHTSNQKALEAVKRKIHAGLFEIRLFNDDFRQILRSQLEILRHNLSYLRHSSVPLVWTLPPLVLLIAQLQFHYGYEGLAVGKPALVKVELGSGHTTDSKPSIALSTPDGIRVDAPAVWIPSLGEMTWRIVPEVPGDYELSIVNGAETVTKTARVVSGTVRRSPVRVRGFLDELLYPAEPPVPAGEIQAIHVSYPETNVGVFGFELHWMIVYFVLSIVFAFVLRGPFGVTI